MTRKPSSPRKDENTNSQAGKPADIFLQMEELQRELLVLAKRAEDEVEALLLSRPEPVIEMLHEFGRRIGAVGGIVSFDPAGRSFSGLGQLHELFLLEADRLQCGLALSGREMSMDFSQGRIYLPVVVFENPIAVAVFSVPSLSSRNYHDVCAAAREGICGLRQELKVPRSTRTASAAAS